MDLGLTLGSLVAITLLSLIAAKLFPVKNRLDEARVRRNLLRYAPDTVIEAVFITSDRNAALAKLSRPEAAIGLVRRLGDRVVCRILTPEDISDIHHDHARITLSLNDFTQPEIILAMDEAAITEASALLQSMSRVTESAHAA